MFEHSGDSKKGKVTYHFIQFVSQYMYKSRLTVQILHYMFRATIFVHHQVVLIQSLSTLSAIPPPFINV
jgi:hypothetical protein